MSFNWIELNWMPSWKWNWTENIRVWLKARSHGAIFFFAFAMWKMDCVGVNEGVHMVRFLMHAMHWCVRRCTQLGCIPFLCDCDVRFQWMRCAPKFTYTYKSHPHSSHRVNNFKKIACKKLLSHTEQIAPCERALRDMAHENRVTNQWNHTNAICVVKVYTANSKDIQ